MRLFVALDIPEEIRRAIGELQENLRRAVRGPAWVRIEGMHITLKFIGEAGEEKAAAILRALRSAPAPGPFEMNFGGLGYFPNERRPAVLWAGITVPPPLFELVASVERALEPLGIPREARAFHAHLTLARLKSPAGVPQLRDAVTKLSCVEFGSAQAREFHLYRSRLTPAGAEYSRMATFPLTEAAR